MIRYEVQVSVGDESTPPVCFPVFPAFVNIMHARHIEELLGHLGFEVYGTGAAGTGWSIPEGSMSARWEVHRGTLTTAAVLGYAEYGMSSIFRLIDNLRALGHNPTLEAIITDNNAVVRE